MSNSLILNIPRVVTVDQNKMSVGQESVVANVEAPRRSIKKRNVLEMGASGHLRMVGGWKVKNEDHI